MDDLGGNPLFVGNSHVSTDHITDPRCHPWRLGTKMRGRVAGKDLSVNAEAYLGWKEPHVQQHVHQLEISKMFRCLPVAFKTDIS